MTSAGGILYSSSFMRHSPSFMGWGLHDDATLRVLYWVTLFDPTARFVLPKVCRDWRRLTRFPLYRSMHANDSKWKRYAAGKAAPRAGTLAADRINPAMHAAAWLDKLGLVVVSDGAVVTATESTPLPKKFEDQAAARAVVHGGRVHLLFVRYRITLRVNVYSFDAATAHRPDRWAWHGATIADHIDDFTVGADGCFVVADGRLVRLRPKAATVVCDARVAHACPKERALIVAVNDTIRVLSRADRNAELLQTRDLKLPGRQVDMIAGTAALFATISDAFDQAHSQAMHTVEDGHVSGPTPVEHVCDLRQAGAVTAVVGVDAVQIFDPDDEHTLEFTGHSAEDYRAVFEGDTLALFSCATGRTLVY